MATESENYANEILMKAAKLRTAQRHIDGWRPQNTNKNLDDTWTIIWNNDPSIPPTVEQLEIASLRQELQDEVIGLPQLIRYLKLVGV